MNRKLRYLKAIALIALVAQTNIDFGKAASDIANWLTALLGLLFYIALPGIAILLIWKAFIKLIKS